MVRVEIRVSDLSRQPIEDERQAARLIVEHPYYPEPIGLDVLPDEITPYLDDEATRFVVLSLEEPDSAQPFKRYAMHLDDFNELFQSGDSETALNEAYAQQQEEQRQQRTRRKGAGTHGGRQKQSQQSRQRRQERIDYASPEYAGTPHRGTISEEEARYVRENLQAVNERLDREGHRAIDPNDPKMAADYGFPPPVGRDEVEERVGEREEQEERA